jgi:hypothetical protein
LWDQEKEDAQVIVERWDLPTPLVTVSAYRHACEGFGEIFAVFDAATMKLIGEPAPLAPRAAFVLDGAPAFVGGQACGRLGRAFQLVPLLQKARKIEVPNLDCPC